MEVTPVAVESVDAVPGAAAADVVAEDDSRDCAFPAVEDPVARTDATPFAVIDCLFSRCNRS